jgi:hypothetical protein
MLTMLAAAMVVISLMTVVVGQAMLANGQIRLTAVETKLAAEQAQHRQLELADQKLETPSRILGEAVVPPLSLVQAGQPTQLPYVSLSTPLATPNVLPATTPTTTATTGQ